MSPTLCAFLVLSVTVVAGFDLGPAMRIAQCRSLCLRRHREVKECKETSDCYMCWETCSLLENDWTVWGSVCQDDEKICFAGCKTACAYHATRVEEQFLPSTLPAPMAGPVYLEAYDVAILFRKFDEDWEEMEQQPGGGIMPLNKTTWIVVVAEDGVRQYSGEFWKPNLEGLKEGALFEASLSWSGPDTEENEIAENPEQREIDSDIAKLNSKMALDFENDEILRNALRNEESRPKYVAPKKTGLTSEEFADRVVQTPRTTRKPTSDVGKIKLYLASDARSYFDEQNARILSDVRPERKGQSTPPEIQVNDELEEAIQASEEQPEIYNEEQTLMETTSKNSVDKLATSGKGQLAKSIGPSYVVSWEPEAGGLMGNQVTDTRSTQISLLPGTKYLVRVASNDGPGSFALEIDTTVKSVEYAPLEAVAANVQPWAILAGCTSALTFVAFVVLVKLCRRTTSDDKLEYV
ncbi:uncharacterized protein LOC125502241 [Athalia rosae]|uniref:uncharacterized protein LOC125502241 n=1 Tax=Athalia rosae TaxID=37344 RepID=UPI00203350E9|nr:uncharacterized protein LOC125502241 [Athalia rosae]